MFVAIRFLTLAFAILCAGGIPIAQGASAARVIETYPAERTTLGRGESLWVRIEYSADEPISVWARPFRMGVRVQLAMTNASSTYVGSGEALGWVSLIEPGAVDEIRIFAGGGKPYREWELVRRAVDMNWTGAAQAVESRPRWVDDLLAAEKARYDEEARRRASEPVSSAEVSLFNGFMLTVLALVVAGIGVPLWSVWKWRGGWRAAALVPAAGVGLVLLRIIVDTARDPTSHNLWPFEIVMSGAAALVCIGALRFARRWMRVEQ
jgi:hypothetical protein